MITTAMLLGLAWKSAAVAGLTLVLLRLARSRSAGERSLVAHAGLVALLALPAASLLLPQWQPLPASWVADAAPVITTNNIMNRGAPAVGQAPVTASVPAVAESGWPSVALPSLSDLAVWVYAVPLALLFGLMALAVVRLFAMRGRADVLVERSWLSALAEAQRRMGFKHGTALLVSDELRSPISWGVLRPTIVLSPNAVKAVGEAEAIIAHELAHVARLDWAKLLGARLACALFWFNPLVWMLARESHQLREEAADDAVLMADIDGPDYATLLVGAARHDNKAALLAAHGVAPARDSLKRRVTRVLDGSLKRGPASASWILMSLAVLAGITAPLAAFSATAERPVAKAAGGAVPSATRKSAIATPLPATAAATNIAATDPRAATAAPGALTAEELVGMRAVGVTPEYVEKMREHGGELDADDIIAAKATGVDPAYIGAIRSIIPRADIDELVAAREMGIDAAFARDMKSHFPSIGLDDLIALKAMGVDCDFVTEMNRAGVRMRNPDDAIELRALGRASPGQSPKKRRTSVSRQSATVSVGGAGSVIEARSADGRVARIEMPMRIEVPMPPEPSRPPVPPGN